MKPIRIKNRIINLEDFHQVVAYGNGMLQGGRLTLYFNNAENIEISFDNQGEANSILDKIETLLIKEEIAPNEM